MGRLFGTDGVRGVAGSELTIELAKQLGQAGAYVLTKEASHQPTIIVGCDTRISGTMLASALMSGICSVGANAVYVGVLPTPAIALEIVPAVTLKVPAFVVFANKSPPLICNPAPEPIDSASASVDVLSIAAF